MLAMRIVMLIAVLGAVAGCIEKKLSPEDVAAIESLRSELRDTEVAITSAEEEDAELSGGLVKALIGVRLEILQTNKALLEQRINSIESGAPVKIVTQLSSADPELAARLDLELEKAKEEAIKANAEASVYGGLVGAMKASVAATQEQTVAMLKQKQLAAKYGLVAPLPLPATDNESAVSSTPLDDGIPRREVEACASTGSTAERSSCYDALALRHQIDTPDNARINDGEWITSSDQDPLTDETISTAMLIAGSRGSFRRSAPTLVVRCKNNTTELYINWQDYLGSDAYTVFRVGQEKATTSSWSLSTDKRAAFYPGSPVGLLKRVIESESFVANITPYNESPITATFNTTGAAEAFADIRQNCGW